MVRQHRGQPAIGPAAGGKTTTTRRWCRSILHLDIPAQAAVVRADPDTALRDLAEAILIDEWQLVPDVLGAVNRAVDDDPRPGSHNLQSVAILLKGSRYAPEAVR